MTNVSKSYNKRRNAQINAVRNEKGHIINRCHWNPQGKQQIFSNIYSNKLENPEEKNKFLETYGFLKLKHNI